ncbi:MFS transporter [Piscirickettsia litoralis]|uniref:Major facilitator superfamily (MFS) profile domain-containing protein n=1 Tax=Piscirickettsia litoralis TaxID=1891921 RepID=A0ABX3A1F5_9GAMM|nr:MFS transporter [Piscirickettsia litoralis]ODN41496.1 hypothetical protein BGC07_15395 [Piscirickettsia litoralis]
MNKAIIATVAIAIPCMMSTGILFSLTVLYFTGVLHLGTTKSYNLNTSFFSLFYCLPLFAGYLSDKYLDAKKILVIGLTFSSAGFFLLSINILLTLSLTFMAVGGGCFLPSIWKLLNNAADRVPRKRLNSFVLSYSALAVSSLISSFLAGFAANKYGYSVVFLIGAIFNLISLCVFFVNRGLYPKASAYCSSGYGFILLAVGIACTYLLMSNATLCEYIIYFTSLSIVVFFHIYIYKE